MGEFFFFKYLRGGGYTFYTLEGGGDYFIKKKIYSTLQAYTVKMFFNTSIVVLLGLLQIAAGVAITLFTTGLMTNVATGFISEGVGDLIFAVSALRSGYFSWSSYWQHKKESIMFTVVTCGIGAFFSRGAQVLI